MSRPLTYLRIIIILLLPVTSLAQKTTDSLIQEMYVMWTDVYQSYSVNHTMGSIDDARSYFKIIDSTNSTGDLRSKILQAESDLMGKDWGLDLSAGYLYNTSAGMDVADNILYKSRIQTQVSWNILNNGLLENKTRSKILENKGAILAIEEESTPTKNADILDNWHRVIYKFNVEKIRILDQRLVLAEKRVDISYQLKSLGKITHEELLNNLESYAEISSLYKIYQDYNENISADISIDESVALPLIDINYSYGLDQIRSTVSDSSKQLMLENLELENKFYNTIDLKLYSRYNYYDLINNPIDNRSFLTMGVGVGVPLNFNKKEKEEVFELKKQQILLGEEEQDADEIKLRNDMLSYMYEFRYKLKQFNTFYYKKLKMTEMLHKEQARFDVNRLDFNPLKALRWLDESMSIDIELLDLKQQLYLYVLRMVSVEPSLDLDQLIVPIELDQIEIERIIKPSKEVYVWSKTFDNYDIGTLLNYCLINNISKVIVSASTEVEKFNEFTEDCNSAGIEVEAMIGDNQLITEFSIHKLSQKLEGINWEFVGGLHLDVEPQTFADWKERQDFYVAQYLKMYDQTFDWCAEKGIVLSVSLPTYFPENAVSNILAKGKVYFMCYENVTDSFLEKKLSKYKGSSFVIALRPEDFNDMAEVELKMESLQELLNPEKFIIHDLERLLKFDY